MTVKELQQKLNLWILHGWGNAEVVLGTNQSYNSISVVNAWADSEHGHKVLIIPKQVD